MARLAELRASIWSNPDGTLAYEESCIDKNFVWWNENNGFCECRCRCWMKFAVNLAQHETEYLALHNLTPFVIWQEFDAGVMLIVFVVCLAQMDRGARLGQALLQNLHLL